MRFFNIFLFYTLGLTIFLAGCTGPKRQVGSPAVSVVDDRFVDAEGRQVILRGASLVNKDKAVNYLGDHSAADFAAMQDWGFNVVRLGVIWDGLEPEPGVYDEAYLTGLDRRIAWAGENGIYVILDMHQDLYSVLFSDGAPEWATITDGKPHIDDSPVWSDAYFSSPAVQTAWDHFWNNSPAPDGVGLQDHYARAWAHLARRYADNSTVVAYDIMNEPFMGSEAMQIFPTMLAKGAEIMAQTNPDAPSAEQLAAQWTTTEGRLEILGILSNIDYYRQVIDAVQPVYNAFEKNKLMPMYQRVADAIRAVDDSHILLLETTMGSNMGVITAIEPLRNRHGEREPLQAYAPHGYDLVTDTKFVASPNPDRIRLIFTRHGETAQRLNMPMIVGEWGAYGNHRGTLPAALDVAALFEQLGCGDVYWDYTANLDETDHFRALHRPWPQRIAGVLKNYKFDYENSVFECSWSEKAEVAAPTVVYIPDRLSFNDDDITIEPSGAGFTTRPVRSGSKNILMSIAPTGGDVERRLVIHFEKK